DNPDLDREQERLRDIGVDQLLGLDPALDHLRDRPAERWPQRLVRAGDRVAERRVRVIGLPAHAGPLRPVPGVYEGELAVTYGGAGDDRRALGPGDVIAQSRDRFGRVVAERDETLRMLIAPPR